MPTPASPAASVRSRARAGMIDEIKAVARRHLASDGANLSLRAVARDMGMVSSALYRYFASRDDLLTALIIDAYDAVGAAAEAGDAAVTDRADLRGRLLGCCLAVREWALANPAEYALIYGSPVPGYAAPQDTVPAAARVPAVLVGILADGVAAGRLADPGDLPEPLRPDLARAVAAISPGLPEGVLARGTVGWIHLFGTLSFELFGQFNNVVEARGDYFRYQMDQVATLIGV
jgi:AcrR family transcriptional regulator